jgi:hypothetical protein
MHLLTTYVLSTCYLPYYLIPTYCQLTYLTMKLQIALGINRYLVAPFACNRAVAYVLGVILHPIKQGDSDATDTTDTTDSTLDPLTELLVATGNMKLVRHIHPTNVGTIASRYGHTHMIVGKDISDYIQFIVEATSHYQLRVLQWLHSIGYFEYQLTLDIALIAGDLDTIVWLDSISTIVVTPKTFGSAAMHGHIHIMEWLHRDGGIIPPEVVLFVADTSNLESLIWLHKHGCPMPEEVATNAVLNDSMPVLEWLASIGYTFSDLAVSYAAGCARVRILEWFYNRGIPLNDYAAIMAAQNGDVETINWLHGHNCPINQQVWCMAAARGGKLENFIRVMELGCQWEPAVYLFGDEKIVQYALEMGYPR